MAIRKQDLLAYEKETDALLSGASGRIKRELTRVYKNYLAQIKALLSQKEFSKEDGFNLREGSQMLNKLNALLQDAGLDRMLRDYQAEFERVTKQAMRYANLMGEKVSLRSINTETMSALVNFSTNQLGDFVDTKLVRPLETALVNGIAGHASRTDAVESIVEIAENLSFAQAETLVNDSFQRYHRFAIAEQGRELGLSIYVYLGPDDDLTRPACQAMLEYSEHGAAGFFYEDEITTDLHPDLEFDPLVAGGGYNCRHHFRPVSLEYAVDQGFEPEAGAEE